MFDKLRMKRKLKKATRKERHQIKRLQKIVDQKKKDLEYYEKLLKDCLTKKKA